MRRIKCFFKEKWPIIFMILSIVVPITIGHLFYKNNHLFDIKNVSHGKILHKQLYAEISGKRIYKWSVIKIVNDNNRYDELKKRQLFYNSQLLLNKNKNKIITSCAKKKQIIFKTDKINKNMVNDNSYLIVDPNSKVIMHYNSSAKLKDIISDVKRLLTYARF
jgi:hypothetical protein